MSAKGIYLGGASAQAEHFSHIARHVAAMRKEEDRREREAREARNTDLLCLLAKVQKADRDASERLWRDYRFENHEASEAARARLHYFTDYLNHRFHGRRYRRLP